MNRPVRSRMQGGVGAGGEIPPATRLGCLLNNAMILSCIQFNQEHHVIRF